MNKTFLSKKLGTILSILFLSLIISSPCSAKIVDNNNQNIEDPDLKLSIEELREKYPIDWFDKEYGEYDECATDSEGESADTKLICLFVLDKKKMHSIYRAKIIKPFEKFTESQIKSIIVHHSVKSYDNNYIDSRLDQILIMLEMQTQYLTKNDLVQIKIRNFMYSDTIVKSFTRLSCESLFRFDVNNKYYDTLVIDYLSGMYRKIPKILKSSFENRLQRCVSKEKIEAIRKKLLKEFKSKIKE